MNKMENWAGEREVTEESGHAIVGDRMSTRQNQNRAGDEEEERSENSKHAGPRVSLSNKGEYYERRDSPLSHYLKQNGRDGISNRVHLRGGSFISSHENLHQLFLRSISKENEKKVSLSAAEKAEFGQFAAGFKAKKLPVDGDFTPAQAEEYEKFAADFKAEKERRKLVEQEGEDIRKAEPLPQPPSMIYTEDPEKAQPQAETSEVWDDSYSVNYSSMASAGRAVDKEFPNLGTIPENPGLTNVDKYNVPFLPRMARVAHKEIFQPVGETGVGVVNLSTMQRINIHTLQRELVRFAARVYDSDAAGDNQPELNWPELTAVMKEYCQALRDWKYIESCASEKAGADPFYLLTTNLFEKKLMEDAGLILPEENFDLDYSKAAISLLPGNARHVKIEKEKFWNVVQLFCWAFGGGLCLIGPVLLMRLHKTLLTELLTTGLSVMAFAVGLVALAAGYIPKAPAFDISRQDVLTLTAAYTAVLVVFISQG